jgi:hypothetical protein
MYAKNGRFGGLYKKITLAVLLRYATKMEKYCAVKGVFVEKIR